MKAFIKQGRHILITDGAAALDLSHVTDYLVLNFLSKLVYQTHRLKEKNLLIKTIDGLVQIEFSDSVEKAELKYADKGQLVFHLKRKSKHGNNHHIKTDKRNY